MHRKLGIIAVILLLTMGGVAGASNPVQTKVFLSPVYTIDKVYRSMEGPNTVQKIYLLDLPAPELLWITGFRTEMMEEDGEHASKPEFMCHVNLDFDRTHRQAFGLPASTSGRLLTLSQGELSVEFPSGYGMPILSNEPLQLTTQVLNLNDPKLNARVRHKVTIEFVRDNALVEPMKPLLNVIPFVMVTLPESDADGKSASCLPSAPGDPPASHQQAPNALTASLHKDAQGNIASGHWVIPPGKSTARTDVTQKMDLHYDTTLHFAAIHLHPFAESLELRDVTANKTVFKSYASNPIDRIGLDSVQNYSSQEGKPLFKDHQYELISVYNNRTKQNSDSMAVMLLFVLNKDFKKPDLSPKLDTDNVVAQDADQMKCCGRFLGLKP